MKSNNNYYILDYKTGAIPKNPEIDFQTMIYLICANEVMTKGWGNNFNLEFVYIDLNADRICPACGAKMVKNPTSVNSKIIIDECYNCGGKFFDHGELTKFREEFPTEEERSKAAMRAFLYSPEAAEVKYLSKASARVNTRLDNRNHSLLGKLFNVLIDKL